MLYAFVSYIYIYNNQNKRIATDFDNNNNNNIFLLECSKQRVVKNRRRRRQLFFTREGVIDSRSNLLHVDEVSAGGGKQSHQYLRTYRIGYLTGKLFLNKLNFAFHGYKIPHESAK